MKYWIVYSFFTVAEEVLDWFAALCVFAPTRLPTRACPSRPSYNDILLHIVKSSVRTRLRTHTGFRVLMCLAQKQVLTLSRLFTPARVCKQTSAVLRDQDHLYSVRDSSLFLTAV